jgi:hypothetical protein
MCFPPRFVPLEAVNKILFSKNKLTIEDFLDEDGSHRILVSVVEGHEKDIDDLLVPDDIDLLMSGIGEFLRKKSLSDGSFLGNFLSYCTGQSFIPDLGCPETSFKVTVEFNFSEMNNDSWPVWHILATTCSSSRERRTVEMPKLLHPNLKRLWHIPQKRHSVWNNEAIGWMLFLGYQLYM